MNARIQVGIRLRPFLEHEVVKGYTNTKISVDRNQGNIKINDNMNNSARAFKFDHIFQQNSTQQEIYEECKVNEMIERVLDGFHSTIFAYGQTGSGKTYTMEGKHDSGCYVSDEMKGIVALSLDNLFSMINKLKVTNNKTYYVTCSFLQIYNEKIYDLLNHCSQFSKNQDEILQNSNYHQLFQAPESLKLRWNSREQFQVENLQIFNIKSPKEAQNYYLQGVKNRITASHKLNMNSSRSHTIFTIAVHSFSEQGAHETSSKLQLVDLAGSERISQTGTEGKMAKESIDINKSLFTLHQVIRALSEINQSNKNNNAFDDQIQNNQQNLQQNSKQQEQQNCKLQHIPYRESKLTSLLKQSIGGNCYCLMVACLVPNDSFSDENISTLHYATRATYIKNQPIKNEDPNKKILSEVQKQNSNLQQELEKAKEYINFITNTLEKSERNNTLLKQQNTSLLEQIENIRTSEGNFKIKFEDGDKIKEHSPQSPSKFQRNGQSQQLVKEQILFEKKQEQFKLQQLSCGQQMLNKQNQTLTGIQRIDKQLDDSSTATTFQFAHNYEAIKQSGQFGNKMNQINSNGFNFYGNDISDIKNEQSKIKDFNYDINKNNKNKQSKKVESKQIQSQIEQDDLNDKLIESITLVRQLLENNKDLRYQAEEHKLKSINHQYEIAELTEENQELRDKLESFQQYLDKNKGLLSMQKTIRRVQSQHNTSLDGINEYDNQQNKQFDEQKINNQSEDSLNQFKINNFDMNNQSKYAKSIFRQNSFNFLNKRKSENKYSNDNELSKTISITKEDSQKQQQNDRKNNEIQNINQTIPASRKNKHINKHDHNKLNTRTLSSNDSRKHVTLSPSSKQNFNFYGTLKNKSSIQNQEIKLKNNNSLQKQNLSISLYNEFGQSQVLNNNLPQTIGSNSIKTNNKINDTQSEFNFESHLLQSKTQSSHNGGPSIDINNLSQTLSTINKAKKQKSEYHNNNKNDSKKEQKASDITLKDLYRQSKSIKQSNETNQCERNKLIQSGRTLHGYINKQSQEFQNEQVMKISEFNQAYNKNNIDNFDKIKMKSKKSNSFKRQQTTLQSSDSFPNQNSSNSSISYEGSAANRIYTETTPENSIFLYPKTKNFRQNNVQLTHNNHKHNEIQSKYIIQIENDQLIQENQKEQLNIQQKQNIGNA